mgnify:CR=1 FL=1
MKAYYYVFNSLRGSPTCKHPTRELAALEAERLAAKHPGEAFEILQCLGISQVVKPVSTFWLDEDV